MTSAAEVSAEWPPTGEHVPVEELARRQGVVTVSSMDELVQPEFFASDEEHDEFLRDLYASRRAEVP